MERPQSDIDRLAVEIGMREKDLEYAKLQIRMQQRELEHLRIEMREHLASSQETREALLVEMKLIEEDLGIANLILDIADKECTKKTFILEIKTCNSSHDGAIEYETGGEDMESAIAELRTREARQAAQKMLSEATENWCFDDDDAMDNAADSHRETLSIEKKVGAMSALKRRMKAALLPALRYLHAVYHEQRRDKVACCSDEGSSYRAFRHHSDLQEAASKGEGKGSGAPKRGFKQRKLRLKAPWNAEYNRDQIF